MLLDSVKRWVELRYYIMYKFFLILSALFLGSLSYFPIKFIFMLIVLLLNLNNIDDTAQITDKVITDYTVWVKKNPPEIFWHFFSNG